LRRVFLFLSLLSVCMAFSFVPLEEPITLGQFGFVDDVKTVKVKITPIGAQTPESQSYELTFDENGFITSQNMGEIAVEYRYDDQKRLMTKLFVDSSGHLLQRISIEYAGDSYTAIAYDGSNLEVGRTQYIFDIQNITLAFSNTSESSSSQNTLYFDSNYMNYRLVSYITERVEESDLYVNMVVEIELDYNEFGQFKGQKMIVRVRNEGQERSMEITTRADWLLTDEKGNITSEIQRTEYSDGSNPPEEFIYSREFTYY